MEPDVLRRLGRNGRVKSRGANTALNFFLLLTAVSTVDAAQFDNQFHGDKIDSGFAFFHSTTVFSSQLRYFSAPCIRE